jgi:Na+-driven multidrug efflux pump
VCVVVTVTFITILSAALNLFSFEIAQVFTKDDLTIELIVNTLPMLSIFILLDAVHGV